MCFSCGKVGHSATRCLTLDETFPFMCLRAVNEPTMMLGEVPGRGLIRQNLNASLVKADIIDSAETGNLLTGEDDVSGVAGSPIRRTSGMPDGGETTFYYEGDLSDSDCRLVEDRERDTWDDWCDSAFHNGYGGLFPDASGSCSAIH